MTATLFATFVFVLYAYLLAGALFAVWFVAKGVDRLDEAMPESNWKVRLLLIPGSVLLWPVLLRKWLKSAPRQTENK